MKFKRRLLSLLLAFAMVLSFVPTALADEAGEGVDGTEITTPAEGESSTGEEETPDIPEAAGPAGEETPDIPETTGPVDEGTPEVPEVTSPAGEDENLPQEGEAWTPSTPEEWAAWKAAHSTMPLSLDLDTYAGGSWNSTPYGFSNQYVDVAVISNGQYTMGTNEGDPSTSDDDNQLLLFGHPSPWSTETVISVDGATYLFHDHVQSVTSTSNSATATAVMGGVTVNQILTLETNPYTGIEDVVSIRYTYTNNSGAQKRVGVRIMLDTMLGHNDGSPFRVNGEEVTYEREYSGNNVPQYWQCFDNLETPRVTSTGFFFFNSAEKPDKVQFTAWPNIVGNMDWNYTVSENHPVTGDSAVVAYFEPRIVGNGNTGSVVTYYGVSGFSANNSELEKPMAVRVTAPTFLPTTALSDGYENNPFDLRIYLSNIGDTTLSNVSVSLVLDEGGILSTENTDSLTKQLQPMAAGTGNMVEWTLRAMPQATDTTVNYKVIVSYVGGENSPKTLDLSLKLPALTNLTRTVSFDMNGVAGTAPATQTVQAGGYVAEPEAPAAAGYKFDGWYGNKNCTGVAWFDVNDGRGARVTDNMTLYAKWTPVVSQDDFVYGIDTFQFINSASDFFGRSTAARNYALSDSYLAILLDGLRYSERQNVLDTMYDEWGGSCFGMSAVLSLVKAGKLDVDFFQSTANCLHDLSYPKDSRTVRDLVNYYFLMQVTSRTGSARSNYNKNVETENNRAVVNAVTTSASPVVVGFEIRQDGRYHGGHAVVAYDCEQTATGYAVKIWDPNDKVNFNTLYISSDYTTSSFASTYDSGRWTSYIKYALTVESGDYDWKNLQNALGGQTSYSTMNDNVLHLRTNYDTFTITNSSGQTATVTNGVAAGTLSISEADYLDGIVGTEAGSLMVSFTLPANDTYTVVPGAMSGEVRTSLSLDNSRGFYASVVSGDSGEVKFSPDGTVETTYTTEVEQTVTAVRNDAQNLWYAVSASGKTTGLTVTPSAAETSVSSKTETAITVKASNDRQTVTMKPVTVGTAAVTLKGENGNTAVLVDSEGNELEKETMSYTVSFYSAGGTQVDSQTVAANGKVAEPDAPYRLGYVFTGWKTLSGADWNFGSDTVNQDVLLVAQWEATNSREICKLTFVYSPTESAVVLVYRGTTLSKDQLPTPPNPTKQTWDFFDYRNITGDKTIRTTEGNWNETEINTDTPSTGPEDEPPILPGVTSFVNVPTFVGGTVIASNRNATAGDWVNLYVTPDAGYELTSLSVTDTRGWTVTLREIGNGSYYFLMPAARVNVNAVFSPIVPDVEVNHDEALIGGGSWMPAHTEKFPIQRDGAMAFADVNPMDWYYESVLYTWQRALMNGTKATEFSPNESMTRAMVWTVLARMNGRDTTGGSIWYQKGMDYVVYNNISDGAEPNGNITRQELITMLWRNQGEPYANNTSLAGFADGGAVADWADSAVRWAVSAGILQGDETGALNPGATATRAEVATILMRYCQNV